MVSASCTGAWWFAFVPWSFWLASFANRILLVFVPLFVVMVPAIKFLPGLFRMKTKLLFYRWYRALLLLERDLRVELTPEKRKEMIARLDEIEAAVNRMKVPASFADQFYGLRGDIDFVREGLVQKGGDAFSAPSKP